jgi:hypothetical protein
MMILGVFGLISSIFGLIGSILALLMGFDKVILNLVSAGVGGIISNALLISGVK